MGLVTCLTAVEWKNALLQVVGEYVGTYTFNSGGTEFYDPAITIGNPPNDQVVCGIEIVIPSYPRIADQYHTCAHVFSKQCWEIKFIQREPDSKGYVLPLVQDRLSRYFDDCSGIFMQQDNILADYDCYLWMVYMYESKPLLTGNDINGFPAWSADV